MKRIFCIITLILTLLGTCLCAVACKKEIKDVAADDEYLGTSDEKYRVEGMSAFDLFTQAHANWLEDDAYFREETLSFSVSSVLGVMGTRSVQMKRKVEGDRIFNQEITKGDGVVSDMTSAVRYYYDGNNAYELSVTHENDLDLSGAEYTVKKWGEFVPFTGDVAEKNYLMTERWTIYELTDKACLAQEFSDNVYKVGDVYYFTLIFDCSKEAMKKYQPTLLSEYAGNMSAPESTLKMENTVIDVAVKNIGGKMRFTAWYRSETYSGKAKNIMETTCKETCYNKMTYTGYAVTDEDLLNLA